jgi:hypothetical protein
MSATGVRAWGRPLGLTLGLTLALAVGASSAQAGASSASSVISEGASASVGSLSTSVQASSQSAQRVAGLQPGDYRVVGVSAHSEGESWLRVQLTPASATAVPGAPASATRAGPVADAGQPQLLLPAAAVRAAALEVGSVLTLRERAYGFELAQGEPRRAFFLLLRDEALPDLQTRPVPRAAPVRL